jgi:hypothetical protein
LPRSEDRLSHRHQTATQHTYAIRLAAEGRRQDKAELITVGQSGEQSLKPTKASCGSRRAAT